MKLTSQEFESRLHILAHALQQPGADKAGIKEVYKEQLEPFLNKYKSYLQIRSVAEKIEAMLE